MYDLLFTTSLVVFKIKDCFVLLLGFSCIVQLLLQPNCDWFVTCKIITLQCEPDIQHVQWCLFLQSTVHQVTVFVIEKASKSKIYVLFACLDTHLKDYSSFVTWCP